MSESHVHQVICPGVEKERDQLRRRIREAESIVLVLRNHLRIMDPALPDCRDGVSWAYYELNWAQDDVVQS